MKEYIRGNVIICIERPVLTDEDRTKREDRIRSALHQYGITQKKEEQQ